MTYQFSDAARILGIPEQTLRAWAGSGAIPSFRAKQRGKRLNDMSLLAAAVTHWIRRRKVPLSMVEEIGQYLCTISAEELREHFAAGRYLLVAGDGTPPRIVSGLGFAKNADTCVHILFALDLQYAWQTVQARASDARHQLIPITETNTHALTS